MGDLILHLPTPDGLHRRCDGQQWLTFLIPAGAAIPMCEHCWNDDRGDDYDYEYQPPQIPPDPVAVEGHPRPRLVRAVAERLDRP